LNRRWRVEFLASARRELDKIARPDRGRILKFLDERIATEENPRRVGHALSGPLAGYWSYRIGDFRLIAEIEDDTVTVLVVRIGNRREVYR
jgi:mRNA interferase RelE/StbE